MRIYTKTGDAGTTSLVGGTRVSKASARLEAYGTVDELNAQLGVVLACDGIPAATHAVILAVQHRLFDLGAQLATEAGSPYQIEGVTEEHIIDLEEAIDAVDATLPRHHRFILPGGTMASAQAGVARTIARRAERCMVALAENGEEVSPTALKYINRLSDYLFVVSRQLNVAAGVDEVFWESVK